MKFSRCFILLTYTLRLILCQQAPELCTTLQVSNHVGLYPEINGVYDAEFVQGQTVYILESQGVFIILAFTSDEGEWAFAESAPDGEDVLLLEIGLGDTPETVGVWATVTDQDTFDIVQDTNILVTCLDVSNFCPTLQVSNHHGSSPDINGVYNLIIDNDAKGYALESQHIFIVFLPDTSQWIFTEPLPNDGTLVIELGIGDTPDTVEVWATVTDQDTFATIEDTSILVTCTDGSGATQKPGSTQEHLPDGVPSSVKVFSDSCDTTTHETCIICTSSCSVSSHSETNTCLDFPNADSCEINSPDATLVLSYNKEHFYQDSQSYGQEDLSYTFVYNESGVFMKSGGSFNVRLSKCGGDTVDTLDYDDDYLGNDCSFDSTVTRIFATDFVPKLQQGNGNGSNDLNSSGNTMSKAVIVAAVIIPILVVVIVFGGILICLRRRKMRQYSERLLAEDQPVEIHVSETPDYR